VTSEDGALLRRFVDHAADGFFVHDAASDAIVEVNAQGCASLGYRRDELIGARTSLFDPHASQDLLDEVARRLADDEAVTFASRHVRKDGTAFPVEVRVRALALDGRRYHVAIVRDTTARHQLEDPQRHADKMDAVGRLAGGVAHDFNNLLTVINGYTDVLIDEIRTPAPQHADLVMIRDAGERAAQLTAQLLAFSRRAMIAPKPQDLNALVARAVGGCPIDDAIDLVLALEPRLDTVVVDAAQLEQVVVSLISNARDAMPRGGQLELRTSNLRMLPGRAATGRYVCLAVTDTGEGMTEEIRARVFEPFFTTKPQGQGSGMGLATAWGIVEQAGGQIRVESAPGRGSTFRVLLPVCDDATRTVAPIARRGTGGGRETVLLAEDEDAVRRLIQRALELHGYSVLPARSGEEAALIEQEHRGPIDLLITDVVMPGMGGRELADTVKARRPELKILYMSGYTNDEVVRHGVIVARDAFLQKPFTPTGLIATVRATFA
jgi:PAS domain S-box-containing protein